MEVIAYLEKDSREEKVSLKGNKVKDLLEKLGLDSEVVLVSKNGELITEDFLLEDKDEVKILPVVSGG
ncbi:MAG: MoaD/ThiS family protein [Candidatus Woesearchaeota archaeon]|nr:MAG: MoaD/ThiS family protein [Candidatus Woesearchaeota archaeon]